MDGCHYDGCVLFERVLHARKGAPEAFHVLGLLHMLDRLGRNLRMRSPSLFSIVNAISITRGCAIDIAFRSRAYR